MPNSLTCNHHIHVSAALANGKQSSASPVPMSIVSIKTEKKQK